MKRLIMWVLFSSALTSFAQVQIDYNADLIPAALKNRANAVIRNMETVVDMRAPENVMLTVKKVVTVLNKNGDDRASLALSYNKNSVIKSIKGVILNAFGMPVNKFSQSNFRDESAVSDISLFEDDRVKRYIPSSIAYPYTIIYEFEIRFRQNLVIPDWYATPYPDLSVEKNSYTFICKPEDKLRIKAFNYAGNPEVVTSDKMISRTWKVGNVGAFKREPYSPDPDKYLSYVKIAPETFTYFGYKGSYSNWTELGRWVYNDLVKNRQTLTPEIIQEVKDLVKGIDHPKEKAKKIYEYVQNKTRYISIQIGIGGFQPFPATDVHRLSYGDCKALVNYTQSLLTVANINSWYCVVNAGNLKKSMEADFASMDQGNHIILCIPLKNDTTWLECTSKESPFGYLDDFTDDRTVFACTEDGGKLLRTPALMTSTNLLQRRADLILDKEGNITGSIKTDFKGSQYDNYARIVDAPYSEQLKLLKDEYDIDNINFSEFKLSQRKDMDPLTSESVNLTIQRYAPGTKNYIYLVPNAFNKLPAATEVKNRTLPVYINRGFTDEDEIVYQLPGGYQIEAKPEDKEIKSPFGSYHVSVNKTGDKLVYKRRFVLNDGTYAADSYNEFASFLNEISRYDNGKVVLKAN